MDASKQAALIAYLSGFINQDRRELLQAKLAKRTRHLTVVIEDVYQSQNASALLRTAECLGLQELHIIENRNAYKLNPAVVKGASKWITLHRYRDKGRDNSASCLRTLQARGYKIAAMSLDDSAMQLEALPIDARLALCFGAEDRGLTATLRAAADYRVRIPIHGLTQSYNVSVSAGISLYQLSSRLRQSDMRWQLSATDQRELYIDWLCKSTVNGKRLMQNFLKDHAG